MGVAPDLITIAKSLAGGFPISGVIGRADVMDAPAPGGLGGTYAGSRSAAPRRWRCWRSSSDENLLQRARDVGERLCRGPADASRNGTPAIGDVRGLGAMVAFELSQERRSAHQPDADLAKRIVAEAARRGLILLTCGTWGNVVRILVPLTRQRRPARRRAGHPRRLPERLRLSAAMPHATPRR